MQNLILQPSTELMNFSQKRSIYNLFTSKPTIWHCLEINQIYTTFNLVISVVKQGFSTILTFGMVKIKHCEG